MTRPTIATLLCFLSFSSSVLTSPSGSLAGHVKDDKGRPIAGVQVTVTGAGAVGIHDATTDAEGFYQFVGLPTLEPLEVTARISDRVPLTYSGLEVREGEITRCDFRLRPVGAHDVLVMYDPRVPYHDTALEGVRATLPAALTVLELSGDPHQDRRLLAETLQRRFNAVIAIGSAAAHIARREVRDSPVVYTMVLDPGVEDLHRINLCGLALNGAFDEQLAVLAALKPGVRRVATIYDPRHLAGAVIELRRAAVARGMRLATSPARDSVQVIRALASLDRKQIDAFFFLLDPNLFDAASFERVRRFAESRKIVFVVPDPSFVAVGGTFSYGPGFREMGIYAARLVQHIFSGAAEPAGIMVNFPSVRSFSVNPFEVDRLGLVIPERWKQGPPVGTAEPGPTGAKRPGASLN